MRRFDFNFEFFAVDFAHTLNFSKDHSISIVESVLLFFVEANQSSLFLGNACDVNRFRFFSSSVKDAVAISEVNKCETVESQVACIDETKIFFMESFVQFDQIISVVVIEDHNAFVMSGSKSGKGYMDSIESSVAMLT